MHYDHGVLTIFFNNRASEQPEARMARLNRQRERDNERRAMEQPEARQSGVERLCERNHQQRAAELKTS